jgi:hypothetical protein
VSTRRFVAAAAVLVGLTVVSLAAFAMLLLRP